MEPERWSLESLVAETRSDVRHLQTDVTHLKADVSELRNDMRRLERRFDDRFSQLLILQIGTLATLLAAMATALAAALT